MGMYELFKTSADEYYGCRQLKYKCQHIPVHAKNVFLIETKYKLSLGRQGVYTIALYHTKSSCLVNGKRRNVFIRDDLPEIPKFGEQNLIKHGTTVDEVNTTIQCLISSYSSGIADVQDCSAIGRSEELSALNSIVENVLKSRHDKNLNGKSETSTDFDHMQSMETKIDALVKSISEIREELQNHIQATTLRVVEIKD
ncbi:hypothetical protein DPMN_145027 [Dreissena polymorpha]|uniref:Uncharacterized protein n=1 Tax=Dreissena polymorpha TaxID=45954 RepID=A0A9D4J0L8_DREPO|nr:hypothetical protein DPMN_145027 [Dreissena polymorpha]